MLIIYPCKLQKESFVKVSLRNSPDSVTELLFPSSENHAVSLPKNVKKGHWYEVFADFGTVTLPYF